MKTNIIAICASFFLVLSACTETENFQLLPSDNIHGVWEEVEPEGIHQFEGTTYTTLNLKPDNTFTLTERTWTDIVKNGDPCNGVTEVYAKGSYTVTDNVLTLDGCYTDSAHRECTGKCDGTQNYRVTYPYSLDRDTLILDPAANVIVRRAMVKR